jgi:hypothetical protein
MNLQRVAALRTIGQGLASPRRETPAALVSWLGAVQSQDYPLAAWSVAQRLSKGTVAAVHAAIADGSVLRTHVLRPTWHFVAREDLRWMQALTANRVLALLCAYDRRLGVDAAFVARSVKRIAAAIERRGHLTRREIAGVVRAGGVAVTPWLVGQLIMHAELRAIVCSGVPRGREQTYALVDERTPASTLTRDEALVELARRYFQSHGPATVRDFRWWSGLAAGDAARAAEMLGRAATQVEAGGRTYVSVGQPRATPRRAVAHLVQPFDEILVAYAESRDTVDAAGAVRARGWSLLLRGVVLDGQVVGRWNKDANGRVTLDLVRRVTAAERGAIDRATERFSAATTRAEA